MGNTTTTTNQSQQYTPTPTETQLMNNELSLSNAALPGQLANQGYAQNLQGLLMNGQNLPGYLNTLPGGVSQGQSMNEANLANQGIATQFQAMGGLDSGSAAQSLAGNYANTLNQNAQFNIENLAQLMNLASGNAYQNVGMIGNNNAMLGTQSGALASSSGKSSQTSNPFLNSFYSGLGNMANGQNEMQTAGQAAGGAGGAGF